MWVEVEEEDAALPSSEPIPAGETGAGTVWTSSPCESRALSTLSWQTAMAWSVKLIQGHPAGRQKQSHHPVSSPACRNAVSTPFAQGQINRLASTTLPGSSDP